MWHVPKLNISNLIKISLFFISNNEVTNKQFHSERGDANFGSGRIKFYHYTVALIWNKFSNLCDGAITGTSGANETELLE